MSCKTNSNPTGRDVFASGVDSYLDTITKYAGKDLPLDSQPKLAGWAKLGTANTVLSMAQAAGKQDYSGMAKAYSAGVAGYVVGDVAFTALAGVAITLGGGFVAIGAAAVGAAALGMLATWGVGTTIDLINCHIYDNDDSPYRPRPDESPTQGYTKQYYDPIILDLDGNGVGTVAKFGYHGAMFDHDGDGVATATGWVDKSDGLLVRDINDNGKIDNGAELFGDSTILQNGQKASSGMEALTDLDDNNDGIIDKNDKYFNELKVWQDKNGDGVGGRDELFALAEVA